MQQLVPWSALIALTEPHHPSSGRVGRPPIGVPRMLRMYFLQQRCSLSDEGLEDAVHDSQAVRQFAGINLARQQVLYATTLLKFRGLLEDNQTMLVDDNFLGRRVASRRNVTRLLVVVSLFFFASSIQWLKAVGMWSKAATVGSRRIVHMPGPRRPRSLFAAVSHLGRHDGRPAQAAQDHLFRPLGAPGLDPTLQRSQLCFAGVYVRTHRRQPLNQRLGRRGGLGRQPAFDNRPRIGERIYPSPSTMLGRGRGP